MLCGHTFCLRPCLLPENSDQKFVCCPLCQIETRVIDLKPMSRDQPENLDALSANSETMRSCPKQRLCQHSSKTVCPACVGNYESEANLPKEDISGDKNTDISATQESTFLMKLMQSTKELQDKVKTFQNLMNSCETSDMRNLAMAQTFETIQLQLQDFHHVISDSACSLEEKPLALQPLAQAKLSSTVPPKGELELARETNRIFVEDLAGTTKHYHLKDYFSKFGAVIDIIILRSAGGQAPSRCGFISFRDWASVRKALDFHPHILNGTRITVSLPKTKRMSYTGSTHPSDRRSEKDDIGATNRAATSPVKDVTTYCSNKTKLFVGRLHPNTTKAELAAYFSRYGYVREVQVLTNRTNRNFGNFGFVTFADSGAISRNVLKTQHRLHGRYLNVQIAISTGQSHLGRKVPSFQDCSTQFGGVRDAKEAIDFVALADSEMARRRTPKTRDIPGDLNAKSDLCARPPKNPHTMLCDHTFCLNPCLMPENSNQQFVRCPFCCIETHVADLEPGRSTPSSSPETPSVTAECREPSSGPTVCDHHSKTICPAPKVHETVMTDLAGLLSAKTTLKSLRTSLCKCRDDFLASKETLLSDIKYVDRKLRNSTNYRLEITKLLFASTYTEDLTKLKGLQRNLRRLKKRRTDLLQTASEMPEKISSSDVKEFEQSTKKLLDLVKDFQTSVESCESSGLDNLQLTQEFEPIQQQLNNLHLVTSDSADVNEKLAKLRTETQSGHQESQAELHEVHWDVNPNGIFVTHLSNATTDCDLYEYFSQFGLITEVFVLRQTDTRDRSNSGFVEFFQPDSVRKVLEARQHVLNEDRIFVSVARRKHSEDNGSVDPKPSISDKEDNDFSDSEDEQSSDDASVLSSDELTIFVGFLKPEVTKSQLTDHFSKFGRVRKATIVQDWVTGKSRGFGFVTFADKKAFQAGVLKACHFLNGCRLSVKLSTDHVQSRATRVRPPLQPEMSSKEEVDPKCIFVGNLPKRTDDCRLHEYFSKFGLITDVYVLNRDDRRSGFVTFRDADSVTKVFDAQPHLLSGSQLLVSHAKKKKSDDAGPHTQTTRRDEDSSSPEHGTTTIFVGRLNPETTEDDLEHYFSKFGTVAYAEVVTHRGTCRSRGFGFVHFENKKAFKAGVLEACHFLNGYRLDVRPENSSSSSPPSSSSSRSRWFPRRRVLPRFLYP